MKNKRVFLSLLHMSENEKSFLLDAFDSKWIAPLSPHIDTFGEGIPEMCVAVSECWGQ